MQYSTDRMHLHRQQCLHQPSWAVSCLHVPLTQLRKTLRCQASEAHHQKAAGVCHSMRQTDGQQIHAADAQAPLSQHIIRDRTSEQPQHSNRRQLLLQSVLSPLLAPLLIGSDDATTIVNSVLSAYGLPTLKASAGYKLYDEFSDDFVFEYPISWVLRPNTLRKGVYISDFKTADKVSVEELVVPANGDLVTAAVEAAVYPGGNRLVEDATLTLPARTLIKTRTETVDGQEMLYLEFPSETTTRSGYNIRRKNVAAAAVKRGKLYTIVASARSDQYDDEKKQMLQHIVQSFRLR